MDELLEKDSQLEAAITEIEFKDNLLSEHNSALEAEQLRSEQLARELAAMRLLQQPSASRTDQPTQLDNNGPATKSPTEEDIPLTEKPHSPSTPA
ncbi:unnamed protein product [Cylindrotheca closterium]|uniref:Uncharacterized protein n=1 Tax=Cylindrotheca closterium TaxID=2856 RepID=A0AAD2CLH7_9STRA|nr:unnamed protein product [Cylindrotheca closterium]